MTTTAMARQDIGATIELALIEGDLSGLSPEQRASHYFKVCESLQLNPYTKPFEYLALDDGRGNEKLTLYARKDCTDQLRSTRGVSITKLEHRQTDGLYIVTAYATDRHGRQDSAIGAVPIAKEGGTWKNAQSGKRYLEKDGTTIPLTGEALANAIMKAETKAKRRVTLSLCGLGLTDESEVESIAGARVIEVDLPQRTEVIHETAGRQREAEDPREFAAAMDAWVAASKAADELQIEHKQIGLDAPTQKIVRWTAALQARIDSVRASRPATPTAEEKAAPRDEATGEVLDGPLDSPAETPTASGDTAELARRSALWQENRRLVARALELGVHGQTLNIHSGIEVIAEANAVLEQRIKDVELDKQLIAEQDKALA